MLLAVMLIAGLIPLPASAKARLVAVFQIRSTSVLLKSATDASKAVVARLASADGYDARLVAQSGSVSMGSQAASSGAEIYIVGQLTSNDAGGYKLTLASFSAATDKAIGELTVQLKSADVLPDSVDVKSLLASAPLTKAIDATTLAAPDTVAVASGLPVKVLLDNPLSSNSVKVGDKFTFRSADDVAADGKVIVTKGAQGEGEVALAESAGGNGHAGKLGLQFTWISSVDGSKISLSNTAHANEGEGNKGAASTATIATYILLGPLGLFAHNFVHGRDVTVDTRTALTAYVDHTVHVTSTIAAQITEKFAK